MKQLDPTKPVQTRDGVPVTIYDREFRGENPLVGKIHDKNYDVIVTWTEEGRRNIRGPESLNDLVNVPETRTVWLNFYPECVYGYYDPEEADSNADSRRTCCIPVTVEL